jgi:hypothetical protein
VREGGGMGKDVVALAVAAHRNQDLAEHAPSPVF